MGHANLMRGLSAWILLAASLSLAGTAHAQNTRVAVGGMFGVKHTKQAILGLQRALKRQNFAIQSTKAFLAEARRRRLERKIPSDAQSLVDLCGVMDVDAVIYIEIARANWRKARRKDRVVDAIVYSGHDGGVLAQTTVRVPKGRLTREVWRKTAKALSAGLRQAVAPPPPPPPVVQPLPAPPPRRRPRPTVTPEDVGEATDPMFVVHAGLSFRSRAFKWTAADSSKVFRNGGIEYDSALVPGVGFEGEYYPFRNTSSAAKGLGVGVQYDKVFLDTEQKEVVSATGDTGNLTTTHQQLRLRLLYERALSSAPDAVRLHALAGMGWLNFDVSGSDDYRGTAYQFIELGGGALIPLGSPLFNLETRVLYVPSADLGSTAKELGRSATATGFNLQGGALLRLPQGLTARVAVDYQAFSLTPAGAGRDGRVGSGAEDTYLGFRLQAGYRF